MAGRKRTVVLVAIAALVAVSGIAIAQDWQRGRSRGYSSDGRNGVPTWERNEHMPTDRFTFVRIEYDSWGGRGGWGGGSWATDYPDSDLNFSYRLSQLTSMEVDPDGLILRLTDPRLFEYPFIYLIEPGRLVFRQEEVEALRKYLLNGGFLMVDDFWGEDEWANFYTEIKQVFPDREPVELSVDHPIFHSVFDLKEKPQVPSINMALRGANQGITWERNDARTPHYKAIYDDSGRMCVIICHNTDLGDGWEREGENEWYFKNFSEPRAYPLGINIVFYALTH